MTDPAIAALALARLIDHRAPAHERGNKDTMQDCAIFEEVLALGSALAATGFGKSVIFVSSNSEEYGTTANPKPGIAADITVARVSFAGNFSHGVYLASQ